MLQPKIKPKVPVNMMLPFVSEIDFDTVPSGTVINTHYPDVTFEAVLTLSSPSTVTKNVFASDGYDQTNADSP